MQQFIKLVKEMKNFTYSELIEYSAIALILHCLFYIF